MHIRDTLPYMRSLTLILSHLQGNLHVQNICKIYATHIQTICICKLNTIAFAIAFAIPLANYLQEGLILSYLTLTYFNYLYKNLYISIANAVVVVFVFA